MRKARQITIGKRPWLATAAVGVAHALGVALLFRPVSGLWNAEPVVEQDWGLHYHHLRSMGVLLQNVGSPWGYNPLFMAGYPSNTIQDASVKLYEIGASALGADGSVRAFKLLAFLATAAIPWLLHMAAWGFLGGDGEETDGDRPIAEAWVPPIAVLLGTAYWWNSLPREMFFFGMIGFPPACAAAIAAMGLGWRFARWREGEFWIVALIAPLLAALPGLHLQAMAILLVWGVITGIGLALATLAGRCNAVGRDAPNPLAPARAAWLFGALAVAWFLNAAWLGVFWRHRGDDISAQLVKEFPYFLSLDPWTFAKDYLSGAGYFTFRAGFAEKGLRIALFGLGAKGLLRLYRERRGLSYALAAAIVPLFAMSYFGSLIPALAGQQPLRFKIPLDLLLAVAAAYELAGGATPAIARLDPRRGAGLLRLALLSLGAAGFILNVARTEASGGMRLRTALPPQLQSLIDWTRSQAPFEARLLFEESGDESGFRHDGVYLSAFLAWGAGRALIGGPANVLNDRHHHAEFHSGRLFKRPIAEFSDAELRAIFDQYNIGAAIVFDRASAERLLACPGLVTLERKLGPYYLLKSVKMTGWTAQGEARVEAGMGKIVCREARGPILRLKYHLIEGMRSLPPVELRSWRAADDPIPMIEIVNPPETFELRLP